MLLVAAVEAITKIIEKKKKKQLTINVDSYVKFKRVSEDVSV